MSVLLYQCSLYFRLAVSQSQVRDLFGTVNTAFKAKVYAKMSIRATAGSETQTLQQMPYSESNNLSLTLFWFFCVPGVALHAVPALHADPAGACPVLVSFVLVLLKDKPAVRRASPINMYSCCETVSFSRCDNQDTMIGRPSSAVWLRKFQSVPSSSLGDSS